ncbi:uncharacterized protein LOC123557337 [Mercenaria mercenaria]|uniref:uncharacterized protein LOC123557337 n=1 Tax=Mercenaria mercenaria TaxID=6596 RepID=UPI00234EF1AB|nr:uncharacterized protein LOC123557337 [Mercenaria mercenaria]
MVTFMTRSLSVTSICPKIDGGLTVYTMIRWCLVSLQYVALCGALTTQPPPLWGGFGPFFGSSWWDQSNSNTAVQVAQAPGTDHAAAPVISPPNLFIEPVAAPATKPPSYETATPVKVTKPAAPEVPTEPSISLHDLIRLAVGGMGMGHEVKGSSDVFKNIFSGSSRDTNASSSDSNLKSKIQETTIKTAIKTIQKLATTAPATKVAEAPATQNKVAPATKTTNAPTTTTKATTTTTTPKPTTTTTTTPKPTTTTTTTTTPKPTTTTTTPSTTTVARIVLTTNKPIMKMTIGEILRLQSNMNAEANQVTVKAQGRPRGCHYKGTFYKPLSEIEKGQTGNWCYGSYCNHEGVVVHWDDHKCTTAQTAPSITKPTETVPPVTQPTVTNPVQTGGMGGMASFMNMAQMAGMGGMAGSGGMADISRFAAMMGGNAGSGGTGGTSGSSGNSGMGCFHNGKWYAPGADIENLRDYGRCYGTYCNYNSEIVNWNDRCTATVPTPTAGGSISQMGNMDQMGMGGGGLWMSQMGIGEGGMGMSQMAALSGEGGLGMGGGGMGMSQMAALNGEGGLGMGGGGMGMSQMAALSGEGGFGMGGGGMGMSQMAALSGEGGLGMGGGGMGMGMSPMAAFGGEGGLGSGGETGMGGQAGMGTQSQGGLSMRQLQQLDLI